MDISFLNVGLAAGAALAALPVILHLFMRQTPKKVVFPALRLIRERQKRSKQKLRVKNWLLLLARMALLALMALALARPTIVSETSVGDRDVPAAIGLVFDTSLSMGYTERDKTRLDEAKERAREILAKTADTSLVFVIDSAEPGVPAGLPPSAARKRIDELTLRAANRPLNVAIGQAYAAVASAANTGAEKLLHEVYVLTDFARSAWELDRPAEGLDQSAKVKTGIKTYVLRLTPKETRNVAIVEANPATDIVVENEPLEIVAKLQSIGPATERIAELWVDGVARGKQPVSVPENGETEVRFTLSKVENASLTHQGEIRIKGAPDPLEFDDTRYFTFNVAPPTRILVVSDQAIDAQFIADAIDPDPATLPPGTPRPYRVDRIRTSAFLGQSNELIKKYRCIFLNNVAQLSDTEWGKLSGFISDGGGLVIGLGQAVNPSNYESATATQVLPAALEKISPTKSSTFFGQATDYSHPLFQKYPKELDQMLAQTPIGRHWLVRPREASRTLLEYADKSPALVERVFKGSQTGRVLLWTTPLSRRPDSNSREAWNDWPVVGWSFFQLMNTTVAYLSESTQPVATFEVGRDVVVPIDPARRAKSYIVQGPDRKSSDQLAPPPASDSIVISAPQAVGQWIVKPADGGAGAASIGFSLNPPQNESQLTVLAERDLDTLLGKDRYSLAESAEELDRAVGIARVGRELFPLLMFAIMAIVTIEGVLSNRFYRETPRPTATVGA